MRACCLQEDPAEEFAHQRATCQVALSRLDAATSAQQGPTARSARPPSAGFCCAVSALAAITFSADDSPMPPALRTTSMPSAVQVMRC